MEYGTTVEKFFKVWTFWSVKHPKIIGTIHWPENNFSYTCILKKIDISLPEATWVGKIRVFWLAEKNYEKHNMFVMYM